MGDRPPKSIKPEADFIPEKEKKITMGNTSLSAIALTAARDRASVAVAMGAGLEPPLRVKIKQALGVG